MTSRNLNRKSMKPMLKRKDILWSWLCQWSVITATAIALMLYNAVAYMWLLRPSSCPAVSTPPPQAEPSSCEPYIDTVPNSNVADDDPLAHLDLRLGRWDSSRSYRHFDYATVGDMYADLSSTRQVCLATQSSIERLHELLRIAAHWSGPMSVAVFVAGDEMKLFRGFVAWLYRCQPDVYARVTFHITIPSERPAVFTGVPSWARDCNADPLPVDQRRADTVAWRNRHPYPQNHVRNLARKNCHTPYVFLVDVDIVPSKGMAESLDRFLWQSPRCQLCAYVVPTYELDVRVARFPGNKSELLRLARSHLAVPFHRKVFIYNQFASNFSRWEASGGNESSEAHVSHAVTNFELFYEPFYVAADTAPPHDERFLGYGFTRNTQILERFWEIEDIPDTVVVNPKDAECETFFRDTHQRDESGRYIVRLPFLDGKPELGDTVLLAKRRFLAMERRLSSNEELREKYIKFMREYEQMGHMSVCDRDPTDYACGKGYVIPHHGIFKAESEKIRVVFDASCGTTTGLSLNDTLHAGPKLQRDVMEIISRFRMSKYVFTTDIKMMFRQIVAHEDDRRYQLIFWREAADQPLRLYSLNTVTYGMKSSPYLAIRTLRQLADDGQVDYPAAANLLRSSVFMDDILGGTDSEAEAKQLKQDLTNLLRSGGFELSKWVSNSERLLEDVPAEDLEKPRTFDKLDGPGFFKILGVEWDPNRDAFSYHCKLKDNNCCTKRIILSTLARTFDPLGWIAPVLFQGKVLMQRLWRLNLSWDETPPPDVVAEWGEIIAELPQIENICMERFVLGGKSKTCSLHGFSDASESGYSAVVYLRTIDNRSEVKVSLMMGKSRVAPSKIKVTIPKLELLGAALLARLIKYVAESIRDKVEVEEIFCWSDSTIVLSWLRMPPHTLQTFEGNRVSQIVNCGLKLKWRHVPSELNPADVASRGCRASELLGHPLWWEPRWLLGEVETWPVDKARQESDLPGIRKTVQVQVHVGTAEPDPMFNRFSSLVMLQSVVAYCIRLAHNARNPSNKITGILTVQERKSAMDRLVRLVQQTEFAEDLDCLKRNKQCSTRLRRLFPFIDNADLLRVGGRLEHSSLPFQVKHPVVLPKNHPLTNLVIDNAHRVHCHVGPTALQAILQKDFWILSARQAIRSRVFMCVACFRTKAKSVDPIMSALPSDRVNATGVFHTVQTDFAGPFSVKASSLRNAKVLKAYLCVFICSSSKAVHLEVVSDLSTEAFTAALSRFTARRGLPSVIRSDNGTNYVGTNRHLNEVHKYLLSKEVAATLGDVAAKSGITWLFNVPGAPHFGGLFEAAVKSAKTLLKRMIGEQVLTFEELTTVFARVEAVLNSRPLCPLSQDPQELEVLTPAHFLVGKALLSVPEYNLEDIPNTRLKRFQLVQAIAQRFWRQWSDRYLHCLQNRNKWTTPTDPPKVGDLVLIKEENVPSLKWRRGRVVELLPGKDGVIRSVRLKTLSGTLLRPVVKICRLPLD